MSADKGNCWPDASAAGTVPIQTKPKQELYIVQYSCSSRLYTLQGKILTQITEDQTWVAQAVRSNAITPQQAIIHPWRHVLSQCLGREDTDQVDLLPLDVQPGDRLLLCSDGLTGELSDSIIAPILSSNKDSFTIAEELVNTAKEKGGNDNITVLIVTVEI